LPNVRVTGATPPRSGSNRVMKIDGQDFLEKLAKFPANTFEAKFLRHAMQLGLVKGLVAEELRLLYRASFRAVLCNIAFNGLGGCHGQIKPELEFNRVRLETEFMAARLRFYSCAGWQHLQRTKRLEVQRTFLNVMVADENLRWK